MVPRLGVLIGLFWLTMTSLLVWREDLQSPPPVLEDTWLGLFAGRGAQRRRREGR